MTLINNSSVTLTNISGSVVDLQGAAWGPHLLNPKNGQFQLDISTTAADAIQIQFCQLVKLLWIISGELMTMVQVSTEHKLGKHT